MIHRCTNKKWEKMWGRKFLNGFPSQYSFATTVLFSFTWRIHQIDKCSRTELKGALYTQKSILTLSRRQDASNVNFLTSPSSKPLAPTRHCESQFRHVKFRKLGVRGFYIIMRARCERSFLLLCKLGVKGLKDFIFFCGPTASDI